MDPTIFYGMRKRREVVIVADIVVVGTYMWRTCRYTRLMISNIFPYECALDVTFIDVFVA